MLVFIRNLLWNLKSPSAKRREEEDAFKQAFNDIPPPEERAHMSPEELAIVLSQFDERKPA